MWNARQVLRRDVAESSVTAPRNVCVSALHDGVLDFNDSATLPVEHGVFTIDGARCYYLVTYTP